MAGAAVCRGYVGGLAPEVFYEEDGVPWMATTDCAFIDEKGLVFILGRADSIIMRNGKAISPGMIENVLDDELDSSVSRGRPQSDFQILTCPFLGYPYEKKYCHMHYFSVNTAYDSILVEANE